MILAYSLLPNTARVYNAEAVELCGSTIVCAMDRHRLAKTRHPARGIFGPGARRA